MPLNALAVSSLNSKITDILKITCAFTQSSFNGSEIKLISFTAPVMDGYMPVACIGGGQSASGMIVITSIGLLVDGVVKITFKNMSTSSTSTIDLYANLLYVKI